MPSAHDALELTEEDGAEEKDGVEQHEAQAQSPVQLPAVQVNAQDSKEDRC